jgi:hypothetical protein
MPVWAAVLGIVATMVGVIAGVVRFLMSFDHDWQSCKCLDCGDRLFKARKRRGDRLIGLDFQGKPVWADPSPRKDFGWLSTLELQPRMMVEVNKVAYLVRGVSTDLVTGGMTVELTNIKTRAKLVVIVKRSNLERKFWEPGYGA